MKIENSPRIWPNLGFTLVEILVVVSVLAIVSGVAVGFVSGVKNSVDDKKLENDVQVINSAIGIYQASGGSLGDDSDPQLILNKLKSVVNADLADRMPGIAGSVIDPRLQAVTTGTIPENPFAEWNPATKQFDVVSDGNPNQTVRIAKFELGDEPETTATEARDPAMLYSKEDTWVWDYQDRAMGGTVGPTVVAVTDVADSTVPPSTTNPNPPPPQTLDPPLFSISGGDHPSADFPLSLSLSNPNPGGSSEIVYWINSDPPAVYSGGLSVSPGDTVSAFANSLDDVSWSDSANVSESYIEEVPLPDISFTMSVSTSGP